MLPALCCTCNAVGGQDELVFDGASLVFDAAGHRLGSLPAFEEAVATFDIDVRPVYRKRLLDPRGRQYNQPLPVTVITNAPRHSLDTPRLALPLAEALGSGRGGVPGTGARHPRLCDQERVQRRGRRPLRWGRLFVVAVVAADALGSDHVHGVAMPSRYSSDHSLTDAQALADALGIDLRRIAIEAAHAALVDMLAPSFVGREPDLTEENLQSRIRGVLLMALSNKFGWMVLTTGNKSEAAVGYSTLYGDTAGGFAVIKDVPKTLVYRLCQWRNSVSPVDPRSPC